LYLNKIFENTKIKFQFHLIRYILGDEYSKNLPPRSIWSCLIEGVHEYSRIFYDLFDFSESTVSLFFIIIIIIIKEKKVTVN